MIGHFSSHDVRTLLPHHNIIAGIPIDIVGGTSIGANIGALLCEERDAEKVEKRAREFSIGMARYTDKIFDLTYPSTSMFTGTYVHMYAVLATTLGWLYAIVGECIYTP